MLPSGWIRSFASSAPSRATGWADDYSRQSAWVLHRNDPPTLREIAKSTYFDGDAVAGDAVTDVPECGVGDIDVRSDGQTVGAQVDAVGFADLDLLPAPQGHRQTVDEGGGAGHQQSLADQAERTVEVQKVRRERHTLDGVAERGRGLCSQRAPSALDASPELPTKTCLS